MQPQQRASVNNYGPAGYIHCSPFRAPRVTARSPVGHERVELSEKVPGFVRAGLVLDLLPLHLIIGRLSLEIDGRRDQLLLRM